MATTAEIILSGKDATKAAFKSIGDSFDKLQGRLGGISGKLGALGGIGLAVTGAFAALENVQAIKILDQLDDLAEKTGISVEKLSELRFAGESVGTPLAALATGISKLGKNMAEAAGGNKEAIATFQALGVEIKNADGTLRASDDVLGDIAEKFASYADGPEKAALAQKVFGKSGEDMIPILNQGKNGLAELRREAVQLGAIYSGDLAKSAADFNDNLTKIKLGSEAAAVAIGGPLISALADLSGQYLQVKKNGESVLPMLAQWAANAASYMTPGGQIALAASWLGGKAVEKPPSAGGGRGSVNPEFVKPRKLEQGTAPVVKSPGSGGAKGPVDNPTKKLLDNRLKELNRSAEEERELMASRNEFLNLYNEQGLISIADYYAQRQNILDDATRKQVAAYDAQIAALKDYQAKAGKDTDRAGAEGKINELLDKRAKVEREAGTQAIKFGIERSKAERDYADELGEVNAKLLELQGNLGAAAAIRFDKQFDGVLKLFSANGNAEGLAKLDILKKFTVAQADLSKVTQGFSLIQGDLQIAEDRITIARERGTMGEIQALQASGEARQRALGQMREQLGLLEKIDVASRTPEQGQAIERLKVQVEQLAAAVDPLADRINTMFSDAATNALTGMFNGTLTPKEAARQFFNSVLSDVGGMLMKDLASKVFGGGESGGIGGLISRALGGGKGEGLLDGLFGGKGAGSAAAMTALTSTTTGATSALALLTSAASSAAAALQTTSLTGGGGGGLDLLAAAANSLSGDPLDNLIGLAGGWGTIPSLDVGTDFVPKDMLALIHKGERIVPASQNKPGRGNGSGDGLVIQINQSVGDIATASMLAASNANLKRELAGAIQRNQRYGGAGP